MEQGNQKNDNEISQKPLHKDKIQTLLGFSVRARKLIYGADTITAYAKKLHLIIVCPTIAENSLKGLLQTAQTRKIPVLKTGIPLEDILFKTNCKAAALKDKQMSDAIILNLNESYTLIK